jgi:uncharacterized protein YdaU (DUF1376 family)
MEKLDWLPVYWQRFIIGTLEMSAEEVGAYFLLILHEWDKGFIPEDPKELKKISRVSVKKLEKVLEKFQKSENNPGKLFNETLEKIRVEQLEKHANNSEKGKKGANARWHKDSPSIAQPLPKQVPSNSIRVEKSREDKIREEYIMDFSRDVANFF